MFGFQVQDGVASPAWGRPHGQLGETFGVKTPVGTQNIDVPLSQIVQAAVDQAVPKLRDAVASEVPKLKNQLEAELPRLLDAAQPALTDVSAKLVQVKRAILWGYVGLAVVAVGSVAGGVWWMTKHRVA